METALAPAAQPIPAQATSDAQVLSLWLDCHPSAHTRRAYERDAARFLGFCGPLAAVTLGDVQEFRHSLAGLSPASQGRTLAAVKSLLAFAHRIGYLPFDVGRPVRLPKQKNRLAERILTEAQVHAMLTLETEPRNRALLHLLYSGGLRVSEICGLTWADVTERGETAQVTIYGKGGATRHVLLPESTWRLLLPLRQESGPVFRSRKGGGHLDESAVLRAVKAAAKRAGISGNVSPHWFRHSHASHALDRGAPVHLVQATLGHSSLTTTGRYLHARPQESSGKYLGV